MKVFKVVVVVLLVLILVVAIGVVTYLQRLDLNQFKPQICEQLSKSLGRPVTIEKLGFSFSFSRGAVLNVENLSIAADSSNGKNLFADIGFIQCEFDVLKFLQEKVVVFSHLDIRSPKIFLVRNKQGLLNLPVPGTTVASLDKTTAPTTSAGSSAVELNKNQMAMPDLRVASFRVTDGQVDFKDEMTSPVTELIVDKIACGVDNFSVNQAFPLTLDAAIVSSDSNLHFRTKVQMDLAKIQVLFKETQLTTNLSKLSLTELGKIFPQIAAAGLEKLEGNLSLESSSALITSRGLEKLSLQGDFSSGYLSFKSLPKPLSDIAIKIEVTENQIDLTRVLARIGSGNISVKATILDYLKRPRYNYEFTADNILLEEVAPPLKPDTKTQGKFGITLKGDGQLSPGQDPLAQLTGQGNFQGESIKIDNLNILKTVLEGISPIPGLYELVYQKLSESERAKLARNYVVFDKITSDLSIQNGIISLPNLSLVSDIVSLSAKADLDSKLNLNCQGTVFVPKDFTTKMTEATPQLSGLTNQNGEMQIPLMPYHGQLNQFKTLPDLSIVGKKIMVNEGTKQIEKLLDKVLGVESTSGQTPTSVASPESGAQPAADSQKNSGKKLIEGVLDSIMQKIP